MGPAKREIEDHHEEEAIQRERARESVRGHDRRRVTQRGADGIRRNAIHMPRLHRVDAIDGIKGLGEFDEDREPIELVADLIHSPKSK